LFPIDHNRIGEKTWA